MIDAFVALAGLALTVPAPARAAKSVQPESVQQSESTPSQPASVDAEDAMSRSAAMTRVADWIAASGDNASLPYAIIDKQAASLFLFDAKGKSLGRVPVLIGLAVWVDACRGICS